MRDGHRRRSAACLLACMLLTGCGGGGGATTTGTMMPMPPMMTPPMMTPPPVGDYVGELSPQVQPLPVTAPRSSTPPLPASAYQITTPITDTVTAAAAGVALGGDTTAPTHAMVSGDIAPAAGESVVSFNSRRAADPADPDQRAATAKQGYAVTVAADAMLTVTRATAVNVVLGANAAGNAIINRGAITVDGGGIALRALSEDGAGDAHAINAGDITVIGSSDASEPRLAGRVVVAGVGKRAAPFDDTHAGVAVNLPGATIRVTGSNNDRIDGLHVEVGSGHLSRLINYGTIDIQARGARALSAQTLWGTTQSHNFGDITMRGENSVGLYAGSCAAWAVPDGCDGRFDVLRPSGLSANFFPGDAYARNHRGGMINTDGRRGYGIRVRPLRAGRAFAINDGGIITTGVRLADGINAVGYGGMRDNEVLTPDTTGHDFVYALNTGTIETSGIDSHGINAMHHRGGDVTVRNDGDITVTGRDSHGITAGAFGNTVTVTPCIRIGVDGQRDTVSGACSRSYAAGDIVIDNTGDITATGVRGVGIAAVSDGGDITITHTGDITANAVGIRAQTTSIGTITINATGDITAPTPLEVVGGDGNTVTPPLTRAAAALDRAQDGFGDGVGGDTFVNGVGGVGHGDVSAGGVAAAGHHAGAAAAHAAGIIAMPLADDGMRFGLRHSRHFAHVDWLRSAAGADATPAAGWRAAVGTRFEPGGLALTPALLLGEGVARVRTLSVDSTRRFRQHGVALRIGDDPATFTVAWRRTRARTDTRVRLPGFALNLREPTAVTDQLRVAAGFPFDLGRWGRSALRVHYAAAPASRDRRHGFGLRFTLPLSIR